MTNAQFSKSNTLFRVACRSMGLSITIRQASKWRNGKGSALVTSIGSGLQFNLMLIAIENQKVIDQTTL